MSSAAEKLTDHETIRAWAEARSGEPAKVETGGEGGILRFKFGATDEDLMPTTWDEFFAIFDDNNLALLAQEETASGETSRFTKFVQR
jgi:hypothetical protein